MKTRCAAVLGLFILLQTLPQSWSYAQILHRRFQITPYVNFKGYGWKEFGDNGDELLKEGGMLMSLGVIPRFAFTKDLRFYADVDLQLYFGSVSYNGFLQDQQGRRTGEFNTDTGYFGFEFAASSGYVFPVAKAFQLTPIGGFEIEYWKRDIGKGDPHGYIENYTTFLANLGVNATYILDRNIQFSSSIFIKIPMTISEAIDMSGTGIGPSDISLNPGTNPRFNIQVGGSFYNTFVELYFKTWTLSKSNEDRGWHQPESTRKNYGIRLGYTIGII